MTMYEDFEVITNVDYHKREAEDLKELFKEYDDLKFEAYIYLEYRSCEYFSPENKVMDDECIKRFGEDVRTHIRNVVSDKFETPDDAHDVLRHYLTKDEIQKWIETGEI